MRLIISPSARSDLVDIADFIGQEAPIRAQSFVEELYEACAELTRAPLRFAKVDVPVADLRRRIHGRYSIFYRVSREKIEIVRIVSSARDLARLFPDD